MRDLYPTLLRVSMVARAEQYSISFLDYLDRETFQHMAKNGMLIRNHNFHQSAEMVSFDFEYLIVNFVLRFSSDISSFPGCDCHS